MNRQSLYCKAICVLIYFFFIHLTFIFGPFTSSFVFCLLCFKFCLQKGFFPLLSFAFCVLTFSFLILSFVYNFCILYFWFAYASSMLRRHPSTPSNFGSRQTYRQTHRQLIAYRLWEGDGNRLIDRYVLH